MSQRFGLFRLDGNHLALPIEALREVVPAGELAILPGSPPFVLGSLALRGQRIPVIDLRRLGDSPGPPAHTDSSSCIVIVRHENRLLGILAEDVEGVASGDVQMLDSGQHGILSGSLDTGQSMGSATLLDPARLLHYPGMPAALQGDTLLANNQEQAEGDDGFDHVMLMHCGSVPLAIPCLAIHTIILNPRVTKHAISSGYCLGTIDYAGQHVPAVSLVAACSIPLTPRPSLTQAFIVRYPAGFVAFMVEHIIDVVQRTGHSLHPLPAQSLARPDHFIGAIPADETPQDSEAYQASPSGHYLLVNADALLARSDLQSLAAMNTPSTANPTTGSQPDREKRRQQGERCQLLTYDLGFEVGTPVSQIVDIVPWQPERAIFGLDCEHAGLLLCRGRSIPLYCLSSTLGIPLATIKDTASVLVVETELGVAGFAVPGLITIEETWLEKLQHAETGAPPPQIRHSRSDVAWRHLLIGQGRQERLLSLLDLQALARDRLSTLPVRDGHH
ncbi:chemotaxis protein CheW [Vogesella urethralis]|uniref:chemotaxis protein CheW n=1 Tax=Vogesella urethralis TaxID=2592656 RepID=UPI0011859210|nr:chemotaxis protein CheW [Vogesella urethralis]